MKKITKLFCFGTLLLASLPGCQNQSNTHHTAQFSDSTHHHDASAETSEMAKAMDNMMADMHRLPMTGNIDVDFAMMMKSHHQGAVEMAKAELSFGKDKQLRAMAQKIIDTQQSETSTLEAFIENNRNSPKDYNPNNKNDSFQMTMEKSMNMMMDVAPNSQSKSTDHQFVNMMIPHHQSAIYMAEALIKYGKDTKLIAMAKKMINDQSKEVDELKKWQNANESL